MKKKSLCYKHRSWMISETLAKSWQNLRKKKEKKILYQNEIKILDFYCTSTNRRKTEKFWIVLDNNKDTLSWNLKKNELCFIWYIAWVRRITWVFARVKWGSAGTYNGWSCRRILEMYVNFEFHTQFRKLWRNIGFLVPWLVKSLITTDLECNIVSSELFIM